MTRVGTAYRQILALAKHQVLLASSNVVLPISAGSVGLSKLQMDDSEDDSDSDDGVVVLTKKPKLQEAKHSSVASVSASPWSGGLLQYLKDPSKYVDVLITYTEQLVVIKDKYPKAKLHLLILPREPLHNLSALTKAHITLLEDMENLAKTLAAKWMANDASTECGNFGPPPGASTQRVLIGFHAVPSMTQLHLHVISNDFDSPALKTKRHWNSFNSPFFLPPSTIIQSLQVSQRIQFDKITYEAYLEGPLKCHRCQQTLPTIPALKAHIASCSKS